MAQTKSEAQQWIDAIDARCRQLGSEASRSVGWISKKAGQYGDPDLDQWFELKKGSIRAYPRPPSKDGRQVPPTMSVPVGMVSDVELSETSIHVGLVPHPAGDSFLP